MTDEDRPPEEALQEFAAARLDEERHEWTTYAEHGAAVTAAIAELAGSFHLHAEADDGLWTVRAAQWPEVRGEVVVRVGGDVATSVGLQLVAYDVRGPSVARLVVFFALGLGVSATVSLWIGELLNLLDLPFVVSILLALLVGMPLASLALAGTVLGLTLANGAWNTRHANRWIAGWRRRFLPALRERVAAGRTYR